jgi:regulator of protease activity HflC (stomatin/prohibitin superfamily)
MFNYFREDGEVNGFKVARHLVSALVLLIVFLGSWTVVGAGQRGVVVRLGNVQDRILDEGPHFKMPILDGVEKINVRTQTLAFDSESNKDADSEQESLFAASADLQDVQIAVVVNYRVHADKVNVIYQQYKDGYVDSILAPLVRDTVKSNSAKYTAAELVQKRAEFAESVHRDLSAKFAEKEAVVESVNIVNFKFSDSFNKAIEEKVTAEQNAQTSKNQLEQAKYDADKRIEQARGEAEAIRIQANAITQQGGEDYVKLQWISKWNGQLPTTSLGDSTPLININR